jgi:hypothetical protein
VLSRLYHHSRLPGLHAYRVDGVPGEVANEPEEEEVIMTDTDTSAFILDYARTLTLLEEAGIRVRVSRVAALPDGGASADIHLHEPDLAKVMRATGVESAHQYDRYATLKWRGATLYTGHTAEPSPVTVSAATVLGRAA